MNSEVRTSLQSLLNLRSKLYLAIGDDNYNFQAIFISLYFQYHLQQTLKEIVSFIPKLFPDHD